MAPGARRAASSPGRGSGIWGPAMWAKGSSAWAGASRGTFAGAGREARLRYVLRPPVAQERVEQRPDGLVRITLKKAYADGTIAVDMDPLSLLCRLATSAPPARPPPSRR